MKEFEAKDFADGLRTGLRAFKANPINKQSLLKAFNVLTSPGGLIPYEPVTSGATSGWFFSGREVLLYLNIVGGLYEVNITTLVHTLVYTFPSGGASRLEVFDAGVFLAITNGDGEYCTKNYLGLYAAILPNSVNAYSYSAPTIVFPHFKTCVNFRNQAIVGNITPGAAMVDSTSTYQWDDCDSNSVAWGDIGKFDMRPGQSNVAGYRKMEWRGSVLKVMILGKSVMVYGSGGIASLNPVGSGAVTFGYKSMSKIGIVNNECVAGNEDIHVYISKENEVWKVAKDMVPKNLGYQEWVEALTASELKITYDEERNRFYISDTSRCFVLTSYGMTECFQNVRSVVGVEGTSIGVITADASPDVGVDILSDTIDFGQRSLKHLEFIEMASRGAGDLEVYVKFRDDVSQAFSTSDDVACGPSGIGRIGVTSAEFQIGIKSTDYTDFYLSHVKSRIKFVDNRSIRGTYNANQG